MKWGDAAVGVAVTVVGVLVAGYILNKGRDLPFIGDAQIGYKGMVI